MQARSEDLDLCDCHLQPYYLVHLHICHLHISMNTSAHQTSALLPIQRQLSPTKYFLRCLFRCLIKINILSNIHLPRKSSQSSWMLTWSPGCSHIYLYPGITILLLWKFWVKIKGNWYCIVDIGKYKTHNHLYQGGFLIMMSGRFPSIQQVVPFFSVSQVLFIILESKPSYLHREVSWESLYQIWGEVTPLGPKNGNFLHPQLSSWG